MAKQKVQAVPAIKPKTEAQLHYLNQLKDFDLTFGLGPAGTGKTYITAHFGCQLLEQRIVDRYVIIRSIVGVEEEEDKIGALPGDMGEKIAPWARPVLDEISKVVGAQQMRMWRGEGRIEAIPIAHIRGLTLDNAFIHVVEAQNLTFSQAKAVVTRHGENSRMVIEGDPGQSDLWEGSYLERLQQIAQRGRIPHGLTEFDETDCVRSERCRQWGLAFAQEVHPEYDD